jgi:hypothetical protein
MYSGYTLPELKKWIAKTVKLNFKEPKNVQADMEIDPPQNISHDFL